MGFTFSNGCKTVKTNTHIFFFLLFETQPQPVAQGGPVNPFVVPSISHCPYMTTTTDFSKLAHFSVALCLKNKPIFYLY